MSEQYRQMSGPTHDLYQRIAQLESQLAEARAELMLAETSVADKCIQIDELQDSYTALVEAASNLLSGMDDYPPSLGQKWLVDSEAIDGMAKHLEDDNAG